MKPIKDIVHAISVGRPDLESDQAKIGNALGMSRQSLNQYIGRDKVPFSFLISFCESNGYSIDSLFTDGLLVNRQISTNELCANFQNIFIVEDDSMEPTIAMGDVAVVDTTILQFKDSGLYLLRFNQNLIIRRLTESFSENEFAQVRVTADNRFIPEEVVSAKSLEGRIAGKVVKRITSLVS